MKSNRVLISLLTLILASPAVALPPPEEVPEEVLRTGIITEARSPVDGRPLTASEYAALQAQIQEEPPPRLDTEIRRLIFLLQIRSAIYNFFPFLSN